MPTLCWDSCICLAWFNNEQDKALDIIKATLREVCEGKVTLLLSAISYAEILDSAYGSSAGTEFEGFVKRPNVVVANVDARVGLIARQIRETSLRAHREGTLTQSVKIPDAIIAATAVLYKAAELHTYDPILREIGKLDFPELRGVVIGRPEDIPPAGGLFPMRD